MIYWIIFLIHPKSNQNPPSFVVSIPLYIYFFFQLPIKKVETSSNVKITSNDDDEQIQDVIIKKEDGVIVNSTSTSKADGQDSG